MVKYKIPIHREVDDKIELRTVDIPLKTSAILKKIGGVPLKKFDDYYAKIRNRPAWRGKIMQDTVEPKELPPRFQNLYKMRVALPLNEAIAYLRQDPEVEYAEPNYIVKALDTTPNDTYYSDQWGLTKVDAPTAWDTTHGSTSIKIAVIDTGVNYNHEDLSSKVTLGYNFADDNDDPDDDDVLHNGHGTHVAGIAAAITNNATGIAGLGWDTKILAVKVLHSSGTGDSYAVAQGIEYAADRASVLNLSLGDSDPSTAMEDAVAYATDQGCLVVAAAGNDGNSNRMYPAAYSPTIATASTDTNDQKVSWSNYGSWISVCAPGNNAYGPGLSNSYSYMSGTSASAPFVAGLAALVWAQNPTWTATQVKEQVLYTADNIDSINIGYAGLLGHGRINAATAVGYPLASISSPTSRQNVQGNVRIIGSAAGTGFSYYKVEVGSGESPSSWTQLGTNHTSTVTDGLLETWDTLPGNNGLHTIKLTVSASNENTYSVVVNVNNPVSLLNSSLAGPNPFNPVTQDLTIQFDLSTSATLAIYIYDITGNVVWSTTQACAFGTNRITWDGKNHYGSYVGNGVYLYRIATSGNTFLGSGKILVYR
ncbi:MAG: S8 family serine peptidase [Candidatus Margulisiibacteriota bacterium]